MRTSKQAVHQYLNRMLHRQEIISYLPNLIYEIRLDHPTLSCRAMYHKLRPLGIGRDAFELFCQEHGFGSKITVSRIRTTQSSGVIRFDNLLQGITLSAINQAWCSDITYYEVKGRYYFITFVMDCYSRRVLGHQVSERLITEQTTLPALKSALRIRNWQIPEGMIFHSDGGGQYYDKEFLKLTAKYNIRNSMCEYAYENGKAERLNGIIKNNYLKHYPIHNFMELEKYVDRAVSLYNSDKPHKSLGYMCPIEYENNVVKLLSQTKQKTVDSFDTNHQIPKASNNKKNDRTTHKNQNVSSTINLNP